MLSSVKSRLGSFSRSSASTSCCPLSRSLTNQARDATSISRRMMIDGDWRTVDTDWWKVWKSSVGKLGWKWWTQFCWWFPVFFLRSVFGASAWKTSSHLLQKPRPIPQTIHRDIAIGYGLFSEYEQTFIHIISIHIHTTSWINIDFADGIHFSAIVAAGKFVTSQTISQSLFAGRLVSNEPEDFQQEFLWWLKPHPVLVGKIAAGLVQDMNSLMSCRFLSIWWRTLGNCQFGRFAIFF